MQAVVVGYLQKYYRNITGGPSHIGKFIGNESLVSDICITLAPIQISVIINASLSEL